MAERPRTRDVAAIREVVGRIRSVDDIGPYAKVGAFGRNGSGKTRFGASGPKPLILDMNEEGTRSAVGSGARVLEIKEWPDVGHAYWYLQSGKHRYETVVIDTATGMHKMAMAFVLGEAETRNPARVSKQPDKRDYGRAGELTSGMLFAFRNLPMHVVLLAQERTITDDEGFVIETTVNLPAGARGAFMDMVGVLGRMEPKVVKKAGKRRRVERFVVGPTDEYPTKDRTNNLGDVVVAPTMSKVLTAWTNTSKEQSDG